MASIDEPTVELLDRFREGDREAYETLFDRYRAPLLRFIRSHLSPELRRQLPEEDLLQETHVAALGAIDRFTYRREKAYFFWLCGIVRNLILNHCRRLHRTPLDLRQASSVLRVDDSTTSADLMGTLESPEPSPLERVSLNQDLHLVARALETLSERQREALILRFIEECRSNDGAARMGISPVTFRVHVSQGLVRLRRALQELLGEVQ